MSCSAHEGRCHALPLRRAAAAQSRRRRLWAESALPKVLGGLDASTTRDRRQQKGFETRRGPHRERLAPKVRRLRRESSRRLPNEALAGAIDEPQCVVLIEREDGDVDLLHDPAKQRCRLERAEPLVAERIAQRVDLVHCLAERVIEAAAARADGIVALS